MGVLGTESLCGVAMCKISDLPHVLSLLPSEQWEIVIFQQKEIEHFLRALEFGENWVQGCYTSSGYFAHLPGHWVWSQNQHKFKKKKKGVKQQKTEKLLFHQTPKENNSQ